MMNILNCIIIVKKLITYSASVFDLKSAKFLVGLKVKLIKIPSGEITNYPLIKYLSKFKRFSFVNRHVFFK